MSDTHGTAPGPLARGALEPRVAATRSGWVVDARRSVADLVLSDESPLAKVLVKGPVTGAPGSVLGTSSGRAARTEVGGGTALVVGSGPGEWLVVGPVGTAAATVAAIERTVSGRPEFVSLIDLTHGRALMRLTGSRAPSVLAKVCAVDVEDAVVPNGGAFRSSVATVVTDVVRDDRDGTPSFLLHCERSTGQFLSEALLDAGEEYGIETTTLVGLVPEG
ncbi:sarcosine oxidase subunit gamma family protein [Actinomycetospora lutea]|uniref:sarcosine oxidase subunit gamma family protein n=1 Tax=Actinomycetospora lutea TaxID=663604 RepID=UPI002366FFBE|nr:sarcosine oxidase subunit gamma family protein [Actinomycetospora lutea]MDD7941598.1 sarcosine oxidase subunit gamma family protein [Actinomycetospora lutea]